MPQHITKTRYAKLVELIKSVVPDDESKCEQIMSGIRNIFDFDPNASTYTPEHAAAIVKSRKKLQEQGISIYVSSGKKLFDQKKKALANV